MRSRAAKYPNNIASPNPAAMVVMRLMSWGIFSLGDNRAWLLKRQSRNQARAHYGGHIPSAARATPVVTIISMAALHEVGIVLTPRHDRMINRRASRHG